MFPIGRPTASQLPAHASGGGGGGSKALPTCAPLRIWDIQLAWDIVTNPTGHSHSHLPGSTDCNSAQCGTSTRSAYNIKLPARRDVFSIAIRSTRDDKYNGCDDATRSIPTTGA